MDNNVNIQLAKLVSTFQRIDLLEAQKARLMQRIDSKYVIQMDLLEEILRKVSDSYLVVEVNGETMPEYLSDYYDTHDMNMYHDHQRKRPKRYKIRLRHYCSSGDSFLEIKFKMPSGKTDKQRILVKQNELGYPSTCDFIKSNTPYDICQLNKTLVTKFNRITLVGKDFNERVTIDLNLQLCIPNATQIITFNQFCVIEIKRNREKKNSKLAQVLKEMGVRPNSFSKYSIGCAILYPKLKKNSFKETLLYLEKINHLTDLKRQCA
jgi:hypothetical protein